MSSLLVITSCVCSRVKDARFGAIYLAILFTEDDKPHELSVSSLGGTVLTWVVSILRILSIYYYGCLETTEGSGGRE